MSDAAALILLRRAAPVLPVSLTAALVFVAGLPVHHPVFAAVAPALAVMSVYFWTVHRPELMPNSVAFAAGLLQDLLFGVPLGVFTLALLTTRAITFNVRGAIQARPVWAAWLGFVLISAVALAIVWALIALFSGGLPATRSVVASMALPAAVYPLFAWPLARLDKAIGERGTRF